MILGKKLSEWLELAIADMQELALTDGVDFDMSDWVALVKKEGASEACTVCLGGCALYKERILPEIGNSVKFLIESRKSDPAAPTTSYDISLVDLSDFHSSARNLLLFFNSAINGTVSHIALQEVCSVEPEGPWCGNHTSTLRSFLLDGNFLQRMILPTVGI